MLTRDEMDRLVVCVRRWFYCFSVYLMMTNEFYNVMLLDSTACFLIEVAHYKAERNDVVHSLMKKYCREWKSVTVIHETLVGLNI